MMLNVKMWRLDTDWYPVEKVDIKLLLDLLAFAIEPNEDKLKRLEYQHETKYHITEKEDSTSVIITDKENVNHVYANIELACTLNKHSEANGKTEYVFKVHLINYLDNTTYIIEMIGEIEELIYILKSSKGIRKYNQDIGKSYILEPVKGITYFDDYIELGEST